MMASNPAFFLFLVSGWLASPVLAVPMLEFDVTAFTNMEHGFQITNRGFVAVLRDGSGRLIAGGPLTMDAPIRGERVDASANSGAPVLRMKVELTSFNPAGQTGEGQGTLSACMPENPQAPLEETRCLNIPSNLNDSNHDDRNWQLIDVPVTFATQGETVSVTKYLLAGGVPRMPQSGVPGMPKSGIEGMALSGSGTPTLGREGSPTAIAASVAHPVDAMTVKDETFVDAESPLVFDLNRDGKISLINVWDDKRPVSFDIEGDGKPSRTGWVAPEDGFLVIDRTGDGKINDGRELFGEYSFGYKVTARSIKQFTSGFAALAQFDANEDDTINSADPAFKFLRIWSDKNSNGKSETSELRPLAFYDIKSLPLANKSLVTADGFPTLEGNELRLVGSYVNTAGKRYPVIDVWFKQRRNPSKK